MEQVVENLATDVQRFNGAQFATTRTLSELTSRVDASTLQLDVSMNEMRRVTQGITNGALMDGLARDAQQRTV